MKEMKEMNGSLQHHGVKGMKWGVRRNRQNGGESGPRVKRATTKQDLEKVKKNVDTANNYVSGGKKAVAKVNQKKTNDRIKDDLTKMSDKELQQIVNRLNMEERYSSVMSQRYASTGQDRATRVLDNVGTALAIGSSALTIMIAMKELQK